MFYRQGPSTLAVDAKTKATTYRGRMRQMHLLFAAASLMSSWPVKLDVATNVCILDYLPIAHCRGAVAHMLLQLWYADMLSLATLTGQLDEPTTCLLLNDICDEV